jgi:hypothetical protein
MEMITEHNLINLLKKKFPKFIPYWKIYNDKWGSDMGVGNDLGPFFNYTIDEIKSENYEEVENIFNFTEFLMCSDDELVKTVIATCFLEDLLNKDPEEIQFIKFSKYLGKESITYLREWNKFQGTETKGL